jgi:hypothetical protein
MQLVPNIKSMPEPISFDIFVEHLGHSVAIGVLLMAVTLLTSWPIAREEAEDERSSLSDLTLESGNLVFLCAGITGVMVLVNNDIARAFAIGAAIALVRFRVRMEKSTASGYFFSLIAGMACGVDALAIGWVLAATYSILKISVYFATRVAKRLQPAPQSKPASAPPAVTPIGLPTAVQASVTADTPARSRQNP